MSWQFYDLSLGPNLCILLAAVPAQAWVSPPPAEREKILPKFLATILVVTGQWAMYAISSQWAPYQFFTPTCIRPSYCHMGSFAPWWGPFTPVPPVGGVFGVGLRRLFLASALGRRGDWVSKQHGDKIESFRRTSGGLITCSSISTAFTRAFLTAQWRAVRPVHAFSGGWKYILNV